MMNKWPRGLNLMQYDMQAVARKLEFFIQMFEATPTNPPYLHMVGGHPGPPITGGFGSVLGAYDLFYPHMPCSFGTALRNL